MGSMLVLNEIEKIIEHHNSNCDFLLKSMVPTVIKEAFLLAYSTPG